jgi:hypothetical protein
VQGARSEGITFGSAEPMLCLRIGPVALEVGGFLDKLRNSECACLPAGREWGVRIQSEPTAEGPALRALRLEERVVLSRKEYKKGGNLNHGLFH